VHLVGFTIEIYYNARSYKRQKSDQSIAEATTYTAYKKNYSGITHALSGTQTRTPRNCDFRSPTSTARPPRSGI